MEEHEMSAPLNSCYVNPSSAERASATPRETSAGPLTWRDAAAPVLAIVLSLLYWAVFSLEDIFTSFGPGLGVPVFVAAYFAAVLLTLGKKARWTVGGISLMTAALALAVSCAVYGHWGLTVMNCFIILAVSALATFSLSGQAAFRPFDIQSLPEAVGLSFTALFGRLGAPFKPLRAVGKGRRDHIGRVLLVSVVTAGLLAVVLALLASADTVFKSLLPDIKAWFSMDRLSENIWRLIRAVVLALFIGSGLCFIREPRADASTAVPAEKERRAWPWLITAAALDVVYIIFCAVQLRYLFGGAETAAMAGGWAEYARTGFFQLVAVAAINLILCVTGAHKGRFAAPVGLFLRVADGLMLALTAVILVSAARRMQLYIGAFGMSVLRATTLWATAVIAAGLLLAGWKLIRPEASFCRTAFPLALGLWCLFALWGPAVRTADYNVSAYLDGQLEEVDTYYLKQLAPDSVPALRRLAAAEVPETGAARDILCGAEGRAVPLFSENWTAWKAVFLSLD